MGSCFGKKAPGAQNKQEFLHKLEEFETGDSSVYWLMSQSAPVVKANRECVEAAVAKNGLALDVVADELKNDADIILKAVENDTDAFSYVNKRDENLWKKKDFVLSLVKLQGFALEFAKELNADKEVVMAAVKQRGSAIQHANSELKSNKDVILAAMKSEKSALLYIDKTDKMWEDKDFVLSIMEVEPDAFAHVKKTASFWKDQSFVLAMVKKQGNALEWADNNVKQISEIVVAAVQQRSDALEFTDKKADFWQKREVVLSLVKSTGRALEFASEEIKKDKDVIRAAIQTTPTSLKFAQNGLAKNEALMKESGLFHFCPFTGPYIGSDDMQKQYKQTELVSFSVKFGKGSQLTDYAANFGVMLEKHDYLSEFKIHRPLSRVSSCDRPESRMMSRPTISLPLRASTASHTSTPVNMESTCLGTESTCQFEVTQKPAEKAGGVKKLNSCWRFSFRSTLEESKKTKGFMIQVQEKQGLGDGQQIETKMAQDANVKIFRTIATSEDVNVEHLRELETQIKKWYKSGRKSMYMEEIFLPSSTSSTSHVLQTSSSL